MSRSLVQCCVSFCTDAADRFREVDFINLMTYDLHGSWEKVTGHNSPLYARSAETGDDHDLNLVSVLCNTTLLPIVSTIALRMLCGAKYTHHTFTPVIKHH